MLNGKYFFLSKTEIVVQFFSYMIFINDTICWNRFDGLGTNRQLMFGVFFFIFCWLILLIFYLTFFFTYYRAHSNDLMSHVHNKSHRVSQVYNINQIWIILFYMKLLWQMNNYINRLHDTNILYSIYTNNNALKRFIPRHLIKKIVLIFPACCACHRKQTKKWNHW